MSTLTWTEIRTAPLTYKDLVLIEDRRQHLLRIIYGPPIVGDTTVANEKRLIAMEQLARMTTVLRWYRTMFGPWDEVESMGADIMEASMSIAGWTPGSFSQPVFFSSILGGDDGEAEEMVLTLRQQTGLVVAELWDTAVEDEEDRFRVLRQGLERVREIDVDAMASLCRSRSEDDIAYHRRDAVVASKRAWTRRLFTRRKDDLDRKWPLVLTYAIPKKRVPHRAVGFSRRGSHEDFHHWQAD